MVAEGIALGYHEDEDGLGASVGDLAQRVRGLAQRVRGLAQRVGGDSSVRQGL